MNDFFDITKTTGLSAKAAGSATTRRPRQSTIGWSNSPRTSIDGPWLPKTASEGLSHTPWIAARLCWKQKLWFRQDNGISGSMLIRGFHYELLNARYN